MRLLVIVFAVAACASRPPCELAPRPPGRPFLWRVERAAGGPTVWLYGTIHDAALAEVPAVALTALRSSHRFASELGDEPPDPHELVELARLPFGQVLSQLLPADDWWDLVNALRGVVREADLQHARPWFAMTQLTSHVAQSPKPSMDEALATRARDQGIAVDHLESWEQQLVALDAAVKVADLSDAIHASGTMRCELAQLRASYDAGDRPAMLRLLRLPSTDRLITARNQSWLPQLEGYFAGDGAFVAVGLGHLIGAGSLPELFERAGYTVVEEK